MNSTETPVDPSKALVRRHYAKDRPFQRYPNGEQMQLWGRVVIPQAAFPFSPGNPAVPSGLKQALKQCPKNVKDPYISETSDPLVQGLLRVSSKGALRYFLGM